MLNFKYYIAIITTLIAQLSMAWTIGGRVTDKDNLPISDASAALIGTTVGTLTDEDGRFSLDVKSDTAILSISMLGYTEERFKIKRPFSWSFSKNFKSILIISRGISFSMFKEE